MVYTVGEMAKLLNIGPSALRFYDREGLLPFVQRSENGVRVFNDKDFRWLKLITCLKSAGMSLKEIRHYIELAMEGDDTVDDRLQMFAEQREKLMAQMKELQQTLDIVEYKCWYYQTAKETGSEEIPQNMTDEEIPEHFRSVREFLRGSLSVK